ncbi:MAG TPA: hypothetical protein VJT33_14005 [bacterium]|nr:hypothetical protein [bacterium]
MSRNWLLKVTALAALVVLLPIATATVSAVTVLTPAGTAVALKLMDPVDTTTVKPGERVHFHVAADVLAGGKIVIKMGTPLTGTVTKVGHESVLNAGFANIGNLTVVTVEKNYVPLKDIRIGTHLFGGNKRIGAGSLVTTGTTTDVTVGVP